MEVMIRAPLGSPPIRVTLKFLRPLPLTLSYRLQPGNVPFSLLRVYVLFNLQHHSRRGVVHSAPNRLDLRDVKVIILLYEQGGSVGGVISRRIGKICPPSGSITGSWGNAFL